MTTLLLIILFTLICISLKKSINRINERIGRLENKVKDLMSYEFIDEQASVEGEEKAFENDIPTTEMKEDFSFNEQRDIPKVVKSEAVKKQVEVKRELPKKEPQKSAFWENLEKLFAGNATGVIGVAAVIAGVIFLAIYAAVNMGSLARFIIVCGFSVSFYAMYILLSKKDFWKDIALWLRTTSGVIFLIAAIGASQFTYMKWVDDGIFAWILILLGIFVNIGFGVLNKKEMFASIHIVLSLFALFLVPFTYLSFVIAAFISAVGLLVALGEEKKWDVHIAIVNIAFMVTNLFWTANYFAVWPSSNVPTISLCLFVALPCLLSHYRNLYKGWDKKALISHMIIWLTLGINLYSHARGTYLGTIGLGIGTIGSFILSNYANKKNIEWLFTCDRLVSLALGILTCNSFYKFDMDYYQLAFFATMFVIIFMKLNTQIKSKIVFNAGNAAFCICCFVYLTFLIIPISSRGIAHYEWFIYLLMSFLVIAYLLPSLEEYARKEKFGLEFEFEGEKRTTTFIAPFFAVHVFVAALLAASMKYSNEIWFLLSFTMGTYLILFKVQQKNVVTNYSSDAVTIISAVLYLTLIYARKYTTIINFELFVMVIFLGLLLIKYGWSEKLKEKTYVSGTVIIWAALMLGSYIFTIEYSTMLTSVLWLVIFLIASDLKELYVRASFLITRLATFTLIAFLARFLLVDISNHTMLLDMFPARVLTEIFSLLALIYWMMSGTKIDNVYIKNSINSKLEVLLILALAYIFIEVKVVDQGILISLLGLTALCVGQKLGQYNRVSLYSYWLFFIGLFNVALVSTSTSSPSYGLLAQVWLKSIITISISIVYVYIANKNYNYLKGNEINSSSKISTFTRNILSKYDVKTIIYPLFIAIAFFLYRSFDSSILSVLWMFECFALFVLSVVMRRSEFRAVSMACVALICFRIIFYDLRGQDFLVKAVIFILIGCILIAMNAIYNKYKYRYEK